MSTKPDTAAPAASTTPEKAAQAEDQYFATKDFRDAGTERSFEKDQPLVDVDAGTLANYKAAGLASKEKSSAA